MNDSKEFELPETTYSRDIENAVFEGIVIQCIAQIEGVSLIKANILGNLLGTKGIKTIQDPATHSVSITLEVNIAFGVAIPEKAEEIQTSIVKAIGKLCSLRVSEIHIVFKGLIE